MGKVNNDDLNRWAAVGGRVETREYRSGVSKFYYTPSGQKLDSWVKARNWLLEHHPEVFQNGPTLSNAARAGSGSAAAATEAADKDTAEAPVNAKNSHGMKHANGNSAHANGKPAAGAVPEAEVTLLHDPTEFEDEDSAPSRPKRRVTKRRWNVVESPSSSDQVEVTFEKPARGARPQKRKVEEGGGKGGGEEEGVVNGEDEDEDESGNEDEDEEDEDEEDDAFNPSASEVESSDSDPDYVPERKNSRRKGPAPSPPSRVKKAQPIKPAPKPTPAPKPDQAAAKRRRQKGPEYVSSQPAPGGARQTTFASYTYQTHSQVPQQQPQFYQTHPASGPGGTQGQFTGQPGFRAAPPPSATAAVGVNSWQQALAAAAAAMATNVQQHVAKPVSNHEAATAYYKAGQYALAEEKYTSAIQEMEGDPDKAASLPVMYGNRAAARLRQGKVDEAILDNVHSVGLDPNYAKAYSRIADCHLRTGDFDKAREALRGGMEKLMHLADKQAELEQKLTQIKELEKAAPKLLQDVRKDLSHEQLTKVITDAKTTIDLMAGSEAVQVALATAYLRQMQFDKCLELCPQAASVPWQWWFALQVRYHLGDLPEAIAMVASRPQPSPDTPDTSAALGVTLPSTEEVAGLVQHMKELITLKEEGNGCIAQKQYQIAVDKYNAALALRPPVGCAAVLYSNRASARVLQALDDTLEPLADSGRAKALKPSYGKPYLRLATQLNEFRRASDAVTVLQELLEAVPQGTKEYKEASSLLPDYRNRAAHFKTPDHYKFLCLKKDCSEEDVRRAYKRRAVVYHPDKAIGSCKYTLQMGESGVVLLNSDLHARLKKEAHTLFTFIAEAYEVLQDPLKRSQVDYKLQSEMTASQTAATKARVNNHYAAQQQAANQARTAAWSNFAAASASRPQPQPTYYPGHSNPAGPPPSSRTQSTPFGHNSTQPNPGAPSQGSGGSFFNASQPNTSAGAQQPPSAFFGFNPQSFGAGAGPRATFFSSFQTGPWQ